MDEAAVTLRRGSTASRLVTGDITQIDLPAQRPSGLVQAKQILQHIQGLKFIFFSKSDVVRHHLVQKIIQAYEDAEAQSAEPVAALETYSRTAPQDSSAA